MFQQEATCGLQVCQHPLCWATNRNAARGLLHGENDEPTAVKQNISESTAALNGSDEDVCEGLPTVTLLNMLDDYGYDCNDRYPSSELQSLSAGENHGYEQRKSLNISQEGYCNVPALALNDLKSHSADNVTVPANTPLQSSHGFGDCREYRSPLGHNRYGTNRTAFNVSAAESRATPTQVAYHKVKLEMGDAHSSGLKPKKLLIWCPDPMSRKRAEPIVQLERQPKVAPVAPKAVSLPLNTVPEYKSTVKFSKRAFQGVGAGQSHHRKNIIHHSPRQGTAARRSEKVRATPQEISQLRKVPIDVLIRVLHQAEEKGVITKKQTLFLLSQVAVKKDKLPPIQETKPLVDRATQDNPSEPPPRSAFETKNMKIHEESQARSPRTVSQGPVYKTDSEIPGKNSSEAKRHLSSAPTGPGGKPITPINMPGPQYPILKDKIILEEQKEITTNRSEAKLQEKEYVEEPGKFTPKTREGISSPKKTPVRYVATVFDNVSGSPPIKPFHYPKSPRDIFLGPIPSPPPPSPPTEWDSAYDERVGGSTMVVNVSTNAPSTVTSYGEKVSSLPSGDLRRMKGANNPPKSRNVASPYESSSGPDAWPQVNEEDYLRTTPSSNFGESPIPPFAEDDTSAVRNESVSSNTAETPLPDKFQNLQRGEIHSPAPPPPSPEPVRTEAEKSALPSMRAAGAATSLGIVTLAKSSAETSPETGGGLTPTPVVSSATSGIETPLGRTTRAQRLGSTPAIAETPFENDEEDVENQVCDEGDGSSLKDSVAHEKENTSETGEKDKSATSGEDFEVNVSPDIAKAELELEAKKLHTTSDCDM